jgi:hypothetical protein
MGLIEIKGVDRFEPRPSRSKIGRATANAGEQGDFECGERSLSRASWKQALAVVRIAVTGHDACEIDQSGNRLNE